MEHFDYSDRYLRLLSQKFRTVQEVSTALINLDAVSYTHLDVYKRQDCKPEIPKKFFVKSRKSPCFLRRFMITYYCYNCAGGRKR